VTTLKKKGPSFQPNLFAILIGHVISMLALTALLVLVAVPVVAGGQCKFFFVHNHFISLPTQIFVRFSLKFFVHSAEKS